MSSPSLRLQWICLASTQQWVDFLPHPPPHISKRAWRRWWRRVKGAERRDRLPPGESEPQRVKSCPASWPPSPPHQMLANSPTPVTRLPLRSTASPVFLPTPLWARRSALTAPPTGHSVLPHLTARSVQGKVVPHWINHSQVKDCLFSCRFLCSCRISKVSQVISSRCCPMTPIPELYPSLFLPHRLVFLLLLSTPASLTPPANCNRSGLIPVMGL